MNSGKPRPMPDNSTINGLSAALWVMVIWSVFMPAVRGEKVTKNETVSSGPSSVGNAFIRSVKNSSVSLSDTSFIISGDPPVFVMVNVIGSDVSPITRLPKS